MPQSIVPSSTIVARRCSWGSRRGCTVKPSGMSTWDSAIRLTTSVEIAVGTATGKPSCGSWASPEAAEASRTSVKTFSSWPW